MSLRLSSAVVSCVVCVMYWFVASEAREKARCDAGSEFVWTRSNLRTIVGSDEGGSCLTGTYFLKHAVYLASIDASFYYLIVHRSN